MSGASDARSAVIAACRHLAGAGLSPGSSGNVSVLVENIVLMTPTGSALSRVTEADLAEIPLDEEFRAQPSPDVPRNRPSKELPLHLAVYRARPNAAAVVHLHSPAATAIACLNPDGAGNAYLPNLTPYRVMRLGNVPLVPYAAPGSEGLAGAVAAAAERNPVLLLAQHGPVVAGRSLSDAVDLAEELETASQLTLLLTGREPQLLSARDVDALTHRQQEARP